VLGRSHRAPECRGATLRSPQTGCLHRWQRDGAIFDYFARRDVPIAPGLVDMLVTMKPEHAADDAFVFSTTGTTPIAYWNFREPRLRPRPHEGGTRGKGITIHGLRSAAISLYAAYGLSMLETATIMGQSDPGVPGSTTPACSTAPTWKPACVPRKRPSARKTPRISFRTETGGGPWRTRLLCLGSYPVTFGDRCDSTATCLVTFLRTTLTPLTPPFVVTV
jgi:hypothetical protein